MSKRIGPARLGIVGCGFATTDRHLPALTGMEEFRIEALADVDGSRCEEVADRFGVPHRFRSMDALLDHREIDAVAICTPPASHAELGQAALAAGKHMLVEKPLAVTMEDADMLAEHASRASTVCATGFNLRCHRLVRQAKALIEEGAVGRVKALVTTFTDAMTEGRPDWRRRRVLGGGVVIDKLVHHFDLWRYLSDDEVETVFALAEPGEEDDRLAAVTARMRGGALAQALASDATGTNHELTVFGERGLLRLDLYRIDGLDRAGLDELPGSPRVRLTRTARRTVQLVTNLAEIRSGGPFLASYATQWREFARAVRERSAPPCTLEDGRQALRIALAATRSAACGAPVEVAQTTPRTAPATGVVSA